MSGLVSDGVGSARSQILSGFGRVEPVECAYVRLCLVLLGEGVRSLTEKPGGTRNELGGCSKLDHRFENGSAYSKPWFTSATYAR